MDTATNDSDFYIEEIWKAAVKRQEEVDKDGPESGSCVEGKHRMKENVTGLFKKFKIRSSKTAEPTSSSTAESNPDPAQDTSPGEQDANAADQNPLATHISSETLVDALTNDLSSFVAFRKGDGRLSRLKHFLGQYIEVMKQVATAAGGAASQVWAPASIITVAVTHVLGAATTVSGWRDRIEDLFDIMVSFAKRLQIIQQLKAVRRTRDYQVLLTEVFVSMLDCCTDVRRRMKDYNYFKDGGRALLGKDGGLQDSYNQVVRRINNLDSATTLQTLAAVDDLTAETKSLGTRLDTALDRLYVLVNLTRGLSQPGLQGDERASRTHTTLESDSDSQKFASLSNAIGGLATGAEKHVLQRLLEMNNAIVPGTFAWFRSDPAYINWRLRKRKALLRVVGQSGMGKSFLVFSIFASLTAEFESSPTTSVVYFAFDEDVEELQTVDNMLFCCAMQIASMDEWYRKALQKTIDDTPSWKEKSGSSRWDFLFREVLGKSQPGTRRNVFIVLDGVDKLDRVEKMCLWSCLQSPRDRNTSIHLVVVGIEWTDEDFWDDIGKVELPKEKQKVVLSDHDRIRGRRQPAFFLFLHELSSNEIASPPASDEEGGLPGWILTFTVELGPDHIKQDLHLVARERLKSFASLSSLDSKTKKGLIERVVENADNFLYLDHVFRRLDGIQSRQFLEKSLADPLKGIQNVHCKLIEECSKGFDAPHQKKAMQYFLVWLARCRRGQLSLPAAQKLFNLVSRTTAVLLSSHGQPMKIDIVEEVAWGRLSKILTLHDVGIEIAQGVLNTSSPQTDTEDHTGSPTRAMRGVRVTFLDRILRTHFGQLLNSNTHLKDETVAAMLMVSNEILLEVGKDPDIEEILPSTIHQWWKYLADFLDLYVRKFSSFRVFDRMSSEDKQVARLVLEGLYGLLSGHPHKNDDGRPYRLLYGQTVEAIEARDRALREFEKRSVDNLGFCCIFGPDKNTAMKSLLDLDEFTASLKYSLSGVAVRWVQAIGQGITSEWILESIGTGHVNNWLNAENARMAYESLRFAYSTFKLCSGERSTTEEDRSTTEEEPGRLPDDLPFESIYEKWGTQHSKHEAYKQASAAFFFIGQDQTAYDVAQLGLTKLEAELSPRGRADLQYRASRPLFQAFREGSTGLKLNTDPHNVLRELTAAIDAMEGILGKLSPNKKDPELLYNVNLAYQMKATVQVGIVGERVNAGVSMMRAYCKQGADDNSVIYYPRLLDDLIVALGESEKLDRIIDLMWLSQKGLSRGGSSQRDFSRGGLSEIDESLYLYQISRSQRGSSQIGPSHSLLAERLSPRAHLFVANAAKQRKEVEWVRTLYQSAAANSTPSPIQVEFALFELSVGMNLDTAQRQLEAVLSKPELADFLTTERATNALAEVFLQKFRSSQDPEVKQAILDQTETLSQRMQNRHGIEFRHELSEISVTLALMRRKMGPARDFSRCLDQSFHACIEALSDDRESNDRRSLQLLAKLLALAPGLEEEAKVAVACRFYKCTVATAELFVNQEPERYDTNGAKNFCGACARSLNFGQEGVSIYTCVSCISMDLCHSCLQSQPIWPSSPKFRSNRRRGMQEPARCTTTGHQFIEAPPTGWKGIYHGRLYFKKSVSNIEFKKWVEGLESKWNKAWEKYWAED